MPITNVGKRRCTSCGRKDKECARFSKPTVRGWWAVYLCESCISAAFKKLVKGQ